MGAPHPFHHGLNGPAVEARKPDLASFDAGECSTIYRTLNPSEVDLDFVGRMRPGHAALDALARLEAGDPINLKLVGKRWSIVDQHGVAIGCLARKYTPPEGVKFVEGRVYAIMKRFRRDSAEDFQHRLRQDEWSVVLPELVYQP